MKTIFTFLKILILVTCIQQCKCKKDEDNPSATETQLPPITTEGKMTLGCKINGKVWLPNAPKVLDPIYASVYPAGGWEVGISGKSKDNNGYFLLNVIFKYMQDSTKYILGGDTSLNHYGAFFDTYNNIEWSTDSLRRGEVTLLRFDTLNQIISGTFSFDCINKQNGEVLKITEGRFDIVFVY